MYAKSKGAKLMNIHFLRACSDTIGKKMQTIRRTKYSIVPMHMEIRNLSTYLCIVVVQCSYAVMAYTIDV